MKIVVKGYTYDSGEFDVKVGDTVILPLPWWWSDTDKLNTGVITKIGSNWTGYLRTILGVLPHPKKSKTRTDKIKDVKSMVLVATKVKKTKQPKKRTVNLVLTAKFNVTLNGTSVTEVKENLLNVIDEAVDNGMITFDTPAELNYDGVEVVEVR